MHQGWESHLNDLWIIDDLIINLVIYNDKWEFEITAYWKKSINEQEYLEDNQPLDFGHPSECDREVLTINISTKIN